jgi:hypothetical protein
MDDLLQQGIAAYKAGKHEEARQLFIAAVKQNRNDERVWGCLYQVANNDAERKTCLQQLLRIKPGDEQVKAKLAELTKDAPPPAPPIQEQRPSSQSLITKTDLEIAAPKGPIRMQGIQDIIEVYEDKITITPKGFLGAINKGFKGTKTIPFISITAIQFKKSGAIFSGYLQFTLSGGIESRGGIFDATKDENTFMFAGEEANINAEKIKIYIEQQIQKLRTPVVQHQPAQASLSSELEKLADLKNKGVLTDEEFQAAKKRLIS